MKKHLYLSLFFIDFCFSLEGSRDTASCWVRDTGVSGNDREDIERPCILADMNCIRNFFAQNSRCSISYGPAPDPLQLAQSTFHLPNANVTITQMDLQVKGLNNAKVIEFYVNKITGNVVFAVEFRQFTENSPRAIFKYQRTGKEPVTLADFSTVTYGLLTFTAIIPNYKEMELDKAEVYADIADGYPPFAIGPGASQNSDPVVQRLFTELTKNLPQSVKESFVYRAQLYMSAFIQQTVCDFGLKYNIY